MGNASTAAELCQEKVFLLRAYSSRTEEYLRAVRALDERSTQDCGELRISVDKARELAEEALDLLDRHKSEHGCG
jgi:hypothetical protein